MRRLRALICLPLLALPLSAAGTATAHAAALDVDSAECTASGTLSTSTGPVPQVVAFSATLTLNCLGAGDDAGAWSMSMTGQMNPGFCAGGQGLADATFNGPDGPGTAGLNLASTATTLHVAGVLGSSDPGGDDFSANLTMTPTSGIPCVNTVTKESLNGSASITDQPPPPDLVFCIAAGNEFYNPGLTTTLTNIALSGDMNLNCQNPVADDAGLWQLTFNGAANSADCGEATGSIAISFTAPEGGGSGGANYERIGTMVDIVGSLTNSHSHEFEVWGELTPNGTCATSAWSDSVMDGTAALLDG